MAQAQQMQRARLARQTQGAQVARVNQALTERARRAHLHEGREARADRVARAYVKRENRERYAHGTRRTYLTHGGWHEGKRVNSTTSEWARERGYTPTDLPPTLAEREEKGGSEARVTSAPNVEAHIFWDGTDAQVYVGMATRVAGKDGTRITLRVRAGRHVVKLTGSRVLLATVTDTVRWGGRTVTAEEVVKFAAAAHTEIWALDGTTSTI